MGGAGYVIRGLETKEEAVFHETSSIKQWSNVPGYIPLNGKHNNAESYIHEETGFGFHETIHDFFFLTPIDVVDDILLLKCDKTDINSVLEHEFVFIGRALQKLKFGKYVGLIQEEKIVVVFKYFGSSIIPTNTVPRYRLQLANLDLLDEMKKLEGKILYHEENLRAPLTSFIA